jgi:sec-independent protein translocase protein TatA
LWKTADLSAKAFAKVEGGKKGVAMNLGWTEILLIGGIALLLFGPKKLPGLGRSLGESIRGFKKALNEDPVDERPTHEQISREEAKPMNQAPIAEEARDVSKKS